MNNRIPGFLLIANVEDPYNILKLFSPELTIKNKDSGGNYTFKLVDDLNDKHICIARVVERSILVKGKKSISEDGLFQLIQFLPIFNYSDMTYIYRLIARVFPLKGKDPSFKIRNRYYFLEPISFMEAKKENYIQSITWAITGDNIEELTKQNYQPTKEEIEIDIDDTEFYKENI